MKLSSLFCKLLIIVSLSTSCSSDPPVPQAPLPPTVVKLKIAADSIINVDSANKSSPVLVRVYELKSEVSFINADFFALFDKESATLGGDLLKKQEFFLKPTEEKQLVFEADPQTTKIGVVATFRKLDSAQWRLLLPIKNHEDNDVKVSVKNNSLNLEDNKKVSVHPPLAN